MVHDSSLDLFSGGCWKKRASRTKKSIDGSRLFYPGNEQPHKEQAETFTRKMLKRERPEQLLRSKHRQQRGFRVGA